MGFQFGEKLFTNLVKSKKQRNSKMKSTKIESNSINALGNVHYINDVRF